MPDVAAGLALAPVTGGMSLPAMLGAEFLAGGIMGAIRPGSFDERLGRAAIGGLAAVGGAALVGAGSGGVGSALRLFRNVEDRTLLRVGAEAENGAAILRQAQQDNIPMAERRRASRGGIHDGD